MIALEEWSVSSRQRTIERTRRFYISFGGTCSSALGDWPAAEASFHKAITVARQQSAKLYELRAATSLARLWRDQGKRDEARDLLAPVYGWFTEGFNTPVLQEAKSLLDELS